MAIPGDLFISVDFGASPSTDNGTRPYTGTNPQWNNFSTFLAGGPGVSQTQTHVGTPTTVKVRVSNKGTLPAPAISVDAYVMNPHIGAAHPSQAIRRLSGFVSSVGPGSGSNVPTDAHVVNCQIQDPVAGPIPWTPTQAELDATNNGDGHLCVIANVFADGDGHQLLEAEDFKVIDDQHQGQRNITLLPLSLRAGEEEPVFEFMIMPAPEEVEETLVAVEAVNPKVAIGQGDRWLLLSHGDISRDKKTQRLVLHHDGGRFPLFLSAAELAAKVRIDDFPDFEDRLPPFRDQLKARIVLRMPEEKIGAMHVFDIVQRDRKRQVLGALRMLTVTTG